MVKFELKEEHIKAMADLNFRTKVFICENENNRYIPTIDSKRPFGNSGVVTSICELLGWNCNEETGEYYAEDIESAENILIELPVALEIVMRNHAFEPGIYDVDEFSSAHFNYRHIKNYHALKRPLTEIEQMFGKDSDQMRNLHSVCMNVFGDDPYEVIDDLKYFAQTYFPREVIPIFEKYAEEYHGK